MNRKSERNEAENKAAESNQAAGNRICSLPLFLLRLFFASSGIAIRHETKGC
jgi:hypothetical protein